MRKSLEILFSVIYIVYLIVACVGIIYLLLDVNKSVYNDINETLYMTGECILAILLGLGIVILPVVFTKIVEKL